MNTKQLMALICVMVMSTGAFAWTMLGPATAELDQGGWSAGYSFSYSYTNFQDEDSGGNLALNMNRHYFDLGYGLSENVELNLLLGIAGIDVDAADLGTTGNFDGADFSWGFNAKCTFMEDNTVDWGAMFQMTWFTAEDTVDGMNIKYEDGYDLQVAVGPTIDMGGWDLYGGGYYYLLSTEMTVDGSPFANYEAENCYGAYVGASFDLTENTNVNVEYSLGCSSWGLGASIAYHF